MHRKCCGYLPFLVVCCTLAPPTLPILDAEELTSVRIKAGDPDPFDSFGRAVSISGDAAVVGAIWVDDQGLDSGAAYVFEFDENNWAQTQKLLSSDGEASDWFGRAVAIHAETILVSANGGRVYVYESDGSTWTEAQLLSPADEAQGGGGGFGHSLGISNDTAIISASGDDENGFASGAAYVFRFNPDTSQWIEAQKLTASDATPMQSFGFAVAIDGPTVVIGAAGDDSACPPEDPFCSSGAAYIFRYEAESEGWVEEQKLLASDPGWDENFGFAVAVSLEAALIGTPFQDNDNGQDAGSVYVFVFDPETSQWAERQKLQASDGLPGDQFGRTLAMDGDLAVVGASHADPVGPSSGAAYVFRQNALGVWVEQCKLVPDPNPWTQFFARRSVAIDGTRVIIGAHGEDTQSGAAYIFELSSNPADLNNDCDVGAFDLALLLASWGPCPKPCEPGDPAQTCPADLNGDCTVGPADLAILLGSWGT